MARGAKNESEAPAKPQRWRLSFDGEIYRERELTIAEAEAIEDFLGMSWLQINPWRSAKQARGILAVLHESRTGRARDDVYATLGTVTVTEFMQTNMGIEDDDKPGSYVDGNPTAAAADRSTSTSSSSTGTRGTGRRLSPVPKQSATSN